MLDSTIRVTCETREGVTGRRSGRQQRGEITPRILTASDRLLSFRVRYRVYCLEREFLDAADCVDDCERDDFDDAAIHVGAFASTGEIAGTARLVLPSQRGFPLHRHCIVDRVLGLDVGEVSRVAIPRELGFGNCRHFNKSTSDVAIQLYRAVYQSARRLGLQALVTAMEPSLDRLLRRIHFPFRPIGPLCDYYGWVRPYLLNLDDLDAALCARAPAIYELFHTPFAESRTLGTRSVCSIASVDAASLQVPAAPVMPLL